MQKSQSLPALPSSSRPDYNSGKLLPGGGRSQGTKLPELLRPPGAGVPSRPTSFPVPTLTTDARHTASWNSHAGQAFEQKHLYNENSPSSYYWILNKSKNHMGYGVDGRVNPGEVQTTAVSGDAPQWMVGPRTFNGPFSTKTVPVRRCPDMELNPERGLIYTHKTYHQGDCMDIAEVHRELDASGTPIGNGTRIALAPMSALPGKAYSSSPPKRRHKPDWQVKAEHNPAKGCHMLHGGCAMQPQMKVKLGPPYFGMPGIHQPRGARLPSKIGATP